MMATHLANVALHLLTAAEPLAIAPLTEKQESQIAARFWETEPFVGSATAKEQRESVGRYFRQVDYDLLRGNPVIGYWHVGRFRWEGHRVAWGGIRAASSSAKRVGKGAWEAAFRRVVQRQGLVSDPKAPIRIYGACVWAVIDPTADEPVPGVVLEIRMKSPYGLLRYRLALGKATVEDAIGASLDYLISFGRQFSKGE